MQNKKILTVKEVSEWLDVTESHVYKMVRCNEIPHFKAGRSIRFHSGKLDEWAKQPNGSEAM